MIKRCHPKSAFWVLFHGQQKLNLWGIMSMQRETNIKIQPSDVAWGGEDMSVGNGSSSRMKPRGTHFAMLVAARQVWIWPWTFLLAFYSPLPQHPQNEDTARWGLAVTPGAEITGKWRKGIWCSKPQSDFLSVLPDPEAGGLGAGCEPSLLPQQQPWCRVIACREEKVRTHVAWRIQKAMAFHLRTLHLWLKAGEKVVGMG